MKKTLLILLLSLLAGVSVQAQTVYQFELENSARTMGNSMAGFVPMRLATFKNAALVYMQRKADAAITPSRDRWLDNQAYHLADFLTLYQIEVTDQNISEADHARLKMMFRDATLAHPAFVDPDETTSLQFVNSTCSNFTPFSLDTDWEKAFDNIYKALRKKSSSAFAKSKTSANFSFQHKALQHFGHTILVVRQGDVVGFVSDVVFSVGHRHPKAGKANHREVVAAVSASDALFTGQPEMGQQAFE